MAGLCVDSLMVGVCDYFSKHGYKEFDTSQATCSGSRDLDFGRIDGKKLTGQGAITVFSADCSEHVQSKATLTVVGKATEEIRNVSSLDAFMEKWFPARGVANGPKADKAVIAMQIMKILNRILDLTEKL